MNRIFIRDRAPYSSGDTTNTRFEWTHRRESVTTRRRPALTEERPGKFEMRRVYGATNSTISRAANDLHTRSAELVKAQEQYSRRQFEQAQLTFIPSPTAWTNADNLIGTIDRRGQLAHISLY